MRKTDGVDNKTGSGDLPVGLFVEWRVKLFFGFSEKYFGSHLPQITSMTRDVHPTEGRIRVVRDAGWDAVDAAALGVRCERRADCSP